MGNKIWVFESLSNVEQKVIPWKDWYQEDYEFAWVDLITLMCEDLAYAQEHGINLPTHGLVYPIVLGNKGDWSWLVPVLLNLATLSRLDRFEYSCKNSILKMHGL